MKEALTNEKLIHLIKNGGEDLNKAIRWIYSNSGWTNIVKNLIRNLGGSRQDQEDIIQDGLISFIMSVQKDKLLNIDGAKAFFVSTCRNMWLNQYNRSIKGKELIKKHTNTSEEETSDQKEILRREFWDHLDQLLEKLGRKCREVLKLWSMGYSHEDIAKKVNYESANVSKKTKSVCIEKLRSMGLNPDDFDIN